MESIIPLGDKVVVLPKDSESISKGGIIIPDTAKEKPQIGVVFASNKNSDLKEGDNVLYGKFCGTEIELNGKEYLMMSENEIFAII